MLPFRLLWDTPWLKHEASHGLRFKLTRLSQWTCSESRTKWILPKAFCWRHIFPLVTPEKGSVLETSLWLYNKFADSFTKAANNFIHIVCYQLIQISEKYYLG